MKILFMDMIAYMKANYNIQLEIMADEIEAGNEVYAIKCIGNFKQGCGTSLKKNAKRCLLCRANRTVSRSNLDLKHKIKNIKINVSAVEAKEEWSKNLRFKDCEELKKIKIKQYDVGTSLASLIVTEVRDSDPNINKEIVKNVQLIANDLQKFEAFFKNLLINNLFDRVYVFNGRLPYARLVIRICQKYGCEVISFERGYEKNKYMLYYNTYPHDLNYTKNLIESIWDSEKNLEEKEVIAQKWFEGIEEGKEVGAINFTQFQKTQNKSIVDANTYNIGIFLSTEDEYVAIGDEWKSRIYQNQNDALDQLMQVKWSNEAKFYIRAHPHLMGFENNQTDFLKNIKNEKFVVFMPESMVSTYQLMRECDLTIVFGSTIGMEAAYNLKPIILLGRAKYEDLKGICVPKDYKECCSLIEKFIQGNMKYNFKSAYSSAIKYAYFAKSAGKELKRFKQNSFDEIVPLGKIKFLNRLIQSLVNKFAKTDRCVSRKDKKGNRQ